MIATEIILGIGNYFSFLSCDRCIRYEQQQRSLLYILRKRDSSRNFVRSWLLLYYAFSINGVERLSVLRNGVQQSRYEELAIKMANANVIPGKKTNTFQLFEISVNESLNLHLECAGKSPRNYSCLRIVKLK